MGDPRLPVGSGRIDRQPNWHCSLRTPETTDVEALALLLLQLKRIRSAAGKEHDVKGLDRALAVWKRHVAAAGILLLATTAPGVSGCARGEHPPEPPFIPDPAPIPLVTKLDLLLVIDNSPSMGDKQSILARAVPELIKTLANPPCIDQTGSEIAPLLQPTGPLEPCPVGWHRRFAPTLDIHVGVISSSIGGHGADSCPDIEPNHPLCGGTNTTNNDKGHLISREDACGAAQIPTYLNQGFLAWDPTGKLTPPGETDLGDGSTGGFLKTVRDMTRGVGQIGCQYPSQLEAWYRFLVDPEPYLTIAVDPNTGYATPSQEVDLELLEQRAAFLRPDSLLAIVMLSDKNDCSLKEGGQNFYAGQLRNGPDAFHLPKARAVCEINPGDPCCYSCAQTNIPPSCPDDPSCTVNGSTVYLTDVEDPPSLRCFDQKRRFGIDFLYPTARYIQALSSFHIPNRAGQLVPNPVYSDFDPNDDLLNTRYILSSVFLMGIVGVPWQDIARDPEHLEYGFTWPQAFSFPDPTLGGISRWDFLLGDPATYKPPANPFMIESIAPRMGVADPNPVNGHERTIHNDDLQYACIFPLAQPKDCTGSLEPCDCDGTAADNPLCAPNPNDGMKPSLQVKAKAYPGLRQLAVLKGLEWNSGIASICPKQLDDPASKDYGYHPVVATVLQIFESHLGWW